MTEFGATDNLANLAGVLRQADEDRMGWLKWAYTGTTRPVRRRTSRHWSSTQPIADRQQRQYGQARRACRAIPAGDRRHAEGLVVQFRHLPASYVTRRLDGQGGFAPGAQTIVSVPAVEYPSGYHVTVKNGQVISAPNTRLLTVVADPGAYSVDVVVTP